MHTDLGMKIHGMGTGDNPEKPLDYWKIARKTAPLLWPENLHLKARVFAVAGVLISARVANLMVPQLYKGAIDTLSGEEGEPEFPTRQELSVCYAWPTARSLHS